jgi:2-deoxystreptamine N-acetyl-D-glucosaminyltransferase/2-deoxystreptamine glucosyltransferase
MAVGAGADLESPSKLPVLRLTPHYYFPLKEWPVRWDPVGGMQTQITQQSEKLAESGIPQIVLTAGMPTVARFIVRGKNLAIYSVRGPTTGIKDELRGTLGLNSSWFGGVLVWVFRAKLKNQNFRLVHSHCSGLIWPLLAGLFVATILRIPLIYTIHCSALATYEPMSKMDGLIQPLRKIIEKWCVSRATKIVILTPKIGRTYIGMGLTRREKLVVIPDSIDAKRFQSFATEEAIERFRSKYKLGAGTVVTYVGRIAHEKGWSFFVQAAKIISQEIDAKFLVCGDGDQRQKLEKMIDNLDLREKFRVTGFIPHEEIPCGLAVTDVLVLPSIHEEFGSVLLEAISMRRPLVASAVGGIPSTVRNNETALLVTPTNHQEIAMAVLEMLQSQSRARSLANNAYQKLGQYDANLATNELIRLYEGI